MKKVLILFVALAVSGLGAATVSAAKYKPGTYKASSPGHSSKKHPGNITVSVTVDEEKITDIKLDDFTQTTKGKQGERNASAKETIPAEILKKQSVAIDSVAKASQSSLGIELAVAAALHEATVKYKDGTYEGRANGYNKPPKHPGEIVVSVTIADGRISDIKLVTFKQSEKGKQGKRNAEAKETMPKKILEAQTTAVDSVAKASFASDGIKIAVARALEQAR